jgi:hypothetical protein
LNLELDLTIPLVSHVMDFAAIVLVWYKVDVLHADANSISDCV